MQKSYGSYPMNSDPYWVSALYCSVYCTCVSEQVQKSHGADPVNSDPHWVSALYCTVCVYSRVGQFFRI